MIPKIISLMKSIRQNFKCLPIFRHLWNNHRYIFLADPHQVNLTIHYTMKLGMKIFWVFISLWSPMVKKYMIFFIRDHSAQTLATNVVVYNHARVVADQIATMTTYPF